VSNEVGIVSLSIGDVNIGACFPSEERGFFDCINNGIFSTFETLTVNELLFRIVLLDPLVVQFPADASDFAGSFLHNDTGTAGALVITPGLASVPIDMERSLTAAPGTQLVTIGMPEGAPLTGNFAFNLRFRVPPDAASVETKPLITGLVELTDGSVFYPPIYPCVHDMAGAPAVTIPLPAPGGLVTLPPLPQDLGCDRVTYNFVPGVPPPSGDADGDGVLDAADACPGTVIPEAVPSVTLGVNRFALTGSDGVFHTTSPSGAGPRKAFTIEETAGCGCEQIITGLGLGAGHRKFGCSISAMEDWIGLLAR
jgi:hypothetical protein